MCLAGTVEALRRRAPHRLDILATHPGHADRLRNTWRHLQRHLNRLLTAGDVGRPHRTDLTQVFRPGFPVSVFDAPVCEQLHLDDVEGYHNQRWTFTEHSGTHVDAPAHLVPGAATSADVALDDFFLPLAVIDLRIKVRADVDATLDISDLVAYERTHGRIPTDAAVVLQSGWDRRATDPDAFTNQGPDGLFHSPGFADSAAAWLLENRSVRCLGTDTLSTDPGNSTTYPVHYRWLRTGRYQLEGLAQLDQVPPAGARIFVGLPPWANGSGGPCRVLAQY